MNCWEFGDYLGIGAGSHGKITSERGFLRTQRTRQPSNYLARMVFMRLAADFGGHRELVFDGGLRLKSGSRTHFQERTELDRRFRTTHLMEADWSGLQTRTFRASKFGWHQHILEC